ncbi:MAG: malonyl-ACP O-methyltransferase BioC [Pseudomonadales bacterium]
MNECLEVKPLLDDENLPAAKLQVNKEDVARSFSLAASTYDQVAALQRSVAENLLTKIPDQAFANIVDLGCGTGVVSAQLVQRFSTSTVFGLDIAEGMLAYARGQFPQSPLQWCCADAENLPLQDNCVDLVFSSLAVQWCADFQQMCNDVIRVLKPGGTCVLATLGPDTLHELRSAWQQVDGYVHVNRFLDSDAVKDAALNAGFECEFWQQDIVMRYPELRQLTAELKALGAHNVNRGRPKGLTGRQRIEKLKAGYEVFRDVDGSLPASYDVYYLRLTKPL